MARWNFFTLYLWVEKNIRGKTHFDRFEREYTRPSSLQRLSSRFYPRLRIKSGVKRTQNIPHVDSQKLDTLMYCWSKWIRLQKGINTCFRTNLIEFHGNFPRWFVEHRIKSNKGSYQNYARVPFMCLIWNVKRCGAIICKQRVRKRRLLNCTQ